MKRFFALLTALSLILALSACAPARTEGGAEEPPASEGYPFKTVTMIVPYGPGGTADLVGRQLAAALGEALGVKFVVENQPGASGAIGCRMALDAAHDGSVVLFCADSLGTQRVMGLSELSYDDYEPIMVTADDPKVVVVAADSDYQTMEELLADIAARPNAVQMAYTGPGGSGHVQALILNRFGYYPALTAYNSGAEGIVAVLSHQVAFTNSNYSAVASFIESGDVRLLAACSTERMERHPDVPALAELIEGSESYMLLPYTPLSLVVAKDVPGEVCELLRAGCAEAVKSEAFNDYMDRNSIARLYERYPTPDDMRAFYKEWESRVSWLIYDAGAAMYSPADFGIERPED